MKNELQMLEVKTIKKIRQPVELEVEGSKMFDDNIEIEFTDGTKLKLASWDAEGYSSGMYKEIL